MQKLAAPLFVEKSVLHTTDPSISIIITSYSILRLNDIVDLLRSISNQGNLELIQIVLIIERDKQLFDSIKRFLGEGKWFNFAAIYYKEIGGMSRARNIATQYSLGKFLAFLDDDVILCQNWLQTVIRLSSRSDWIGLTGPSSPVWVGEPVNWFPPELSWVLGSTDWFDNGDEVSIRNAWGNNMVVRKAEFVDVGGFIEDYGLRSASRTTWTDPPSEDVDLSIRMTRKFKRPILFLPGLKVGHKVLQSKLTWRFMAQRSYSTGFQRRAIEKLYDRSGEQNILRMEKSLIPRMLVLIPRSLFSLFRKPRDNLRILGALVLVLVFSSLGYLKK